jgi:DMSO/TMAO reductase YedYZ molybdopterin-dependent catalytic subunit
MNHQKSNLEDWSEEKIKRRSFMSFAFFAAASVTGIGAWRYFRALAESDNGLSSASRSIFNINEKANNIAFDTKHLAPTYPKSVATLSPRVNGNVGIDEAIDLAEWELEVVNPTTNVSTYLDMADFKDMPKEDIVFDFKCIEGWNEIVHYGGVKLSDFMQKYKFGQKEGSNEWYKYVGMETPDGEYYIGLDMKSALHPQTLLCFEMNGKSLPIEHGAPLRLIIPVKYGVKNLKCIGKIFFSDAPPRDYWHENGYVYDAAL